MPREAARFRVSFAYAACRAQMICGVTSAQTRHASYRWAKLRKISRVLLHIVKTEYPDQTPNRASLTRKLSLNIP
jgi:hypothetical protein